MLTTVDPTSLLQVLWENSVEGVALVDRRNVIVAINPAYTEIMGYTVAEIVGKTSEITRSGYHDDAFYHAIWQALETTGHWTGEMMIRRKNAEVFSEWLVMHAIRDAAGNVTHYAVIFSDITERRLSEERIQFLKNFDPLTELPNRHAAVSELENRLRHTTHYLPIAVFVIGIDGFKHINVSFGLEAGDALLKQFATRLQSCFSQNGMVARSGSDKFLGLVWQVPDHDAVRYIIEKVISVIKQPFAIAEQPVTLTASVGISLAPTDGTDSSALLQHAETALFQAKMEQRGSYQFFTEAMHDSVKERFTLENALRAAIDTHAFELYYQPIVSLQTRQLVSVEALLRWPRDNAFIAPDKFIPVAEASGLILPLTDWVLLQACRDQQQWLATTGMRVPVAVNMSAKKFRQVDFLKQVLQLLQTQHVQPGQLKFEITESIFMDDAETIIQLLQIVREQGIRIAMDDFGTGYSSLSYLKKLPLDDIKIDKAFIHDLETDAESRAIIVSVIQLAKSLGLHIIAEGVETAGQIQFLRAEGCDAIQGYYFSKPLPAHDLLALLTSHKTLDC